MTPKPVLLSWVYLAVGANWRRIGKYNTKTYYAQLGLSGWWRKLVAQLAAHIRRIGKYDNKVCFAKLGLSGCWRKLAAHREILHQNPFCATGLVWLVAQVGGAACGA